LLWRLLLPPLLLLLMIGRGVKVDLILLRKKQVI
jgi:hypothetical protein